MRQTRTNRNNNGTTEPPKDQKNKNPEYIYYAIIALLLIILIGIAVFIYSNRDTATDTTDDNGTFDSEEMTDSDNEEDGMIIEENDEEDESDAPDEADDAEEDEAEETDTDTSDEDETDDADTDDNGDTDETDESEVSVNDDAPLDESYVPNYNNGSADRNAIAGLVSSVTGLDQSSMITWRVGNNGPGRVFAVMSDSSQNDVYRTFLQYGDGEWHVTAYEQLPEVPAEFR